jgi:hypothetical protein
VARLPEVLRDPLILAVLGMPRPVPSGEAEAKRERV